MVLTPTGRKRTIRRLPAVAMAAALSFAPYLPPPSALAQTADSTARQTHGAWQINCGTPPGAKKEHCAAIQSVTAEDRPNVGLTVIFLKSIDSTRKLLRVVAPLGVLLPTGLGLRVDSKDVGRVPFMKCGLAGCIAEVEADKTLIRKLQTGSTAMFIIFQTPEEGIAIPISLDGFTAAFNSLK